MDYFVEDELHLFIFDEIDSLFKQRGKGSGTGTMVGDNMVNTLLSIMDGSEELHSCGVLHIAGKC